MVNRGSAAEKIFAKPRRSRRLANPAGRVCQSVHCSKCRGGRPHDSTANYRISVKLNCEAPPGYIRDQLVVVTNDLDAKAARADRHRGAGSGFTERLAVVDGRDQAGQPVTRNLVVEGPAPFRIVGIRLSDPRFHCKSSAKITRCHVHVTFLAGQSDDSEGCVAAKIHVETDLPGGQSIEASVSIQVVRDDWEAVARCGVYPMRDMDPMCVGGSRRSTGRRSPGSG